MEILASLCRPEFNKWVVRHCNAKTVITSHCNVLHARLKSALLIQVREKDTAQKGYKIPHPDPVSLKTSTFQEKHDFKGLRKEIRHVFEIMKSRLMTEILMVGRQIPAIRSGKNIWLFQHARTL